MYTLGVDSTLKQQKYIIRTDRAGVFFAEVADRTGTEATLTNARRIWSWSNATECISIATNGLGSSSRITVTVPQMVVTGVIEVIPCSEKATAILEAHPEWKA